MTLGQTPISRLLAAADLPENEETVIAFEADAAERAAIAQRLGVPAVSEFKADLRVVKRPHDRVRVEGEVRARLTRVCVVSLDPFEVDANEEIALDYAPAEEAAAAAARQAHEPAPGESLADQPDPPDPLVDGRFDLGEAACEFLALSLDPYPRKPGVTFSPPEDDSVKDESPFAALKRLKLDKDERGK